MSHPTVEVAPKGAATGVNGSGSIPKVSAKSTRKAARKNAKKSTKKSTKKSAAKSAKPKEDSKGRKIYPGMSFKEALPLAEAIQKFASGERVRRLTLLSQMNKSPTSGPTRALITASARYHLTTGSFGAEWLELTEVGKIATAQETPEREKREAEFKLAIEEVSPFKYLYEQYRGKKLPSHEVMKDVLAEFSQPIEDPKECIDIFIVNAKYLGLLQTIAGSETLLTITAALDDFVLKRSSDEVRSGVSSELARVTVATTEGKVAWSKMCFYISPIGDEGTEIRKHSDLFLGSLVEPALKDIGLDVIRADKIGEPGMITSQVIEHIMRAKLVIVDMSYHNPNVFYEMALRHACKLPIVQMTRRHDRLPFDLNQMRTVVVDTADIYTLVPRLETLRSEIATQVRAALADSEGTATPISTFFPGFSVTIPKEK